MLWSAGEGGEVGHWKMNKLVVRGNEECMDENCNCEGGGGGFTGHCQIEYLLTWRAAGLEVIVGVWGIET